MTPEIYQLESPKDVRIFSGNNSLTVCWRPINTENISGYYVHFGTSSGNYQKKLQVPPNKNTIKISNLAQNKKYYIAVSAEDRDGTLSEFSEEMSAYTYLAYENFSQTTGLLDTTKWRSEKDLLIPVTDSIVSATEIIFNDHRMTKSFGQYLNPTPTNNFAVECQFQLGTPNIGGAGLMIRSEKANNNQYYKGYFAYLFWNVDHWNLHLEESPLNRFGIQKIQPVTLPDLNHDEWIKLIVVFKNGQLKVYAVRMSDLVIVGKIVATENKRSRRPNNSDVYCGFFTKQYGGNIIYTDNFGIYYSD